MAFLIIFTPITFPRILLIKKETRKIVWNFLLRQQLFFPLYFPLLCECKRGIVSPFSIIIVPKIPQNCRARANVTFSNQGYNDIVALSP